jgi:glycosyltransferase involved in cell wall biosynthesis
MNLIFLTLLNINSVSERGLYTDLLRKFRDEGHNVFVICPIERKYKQRTNVIEKDGVTILQVKTFNIQKANLLEKGIGTLLIEYQFLHAARRYYKDKFFDLILYSTPPITFTKVVNNFKRHNNAVTYLLLKDIFPQNAVDLGMIKQDSFIHRYFRTKEKALYKISNYIGCMSPGNRDYVLRHNEEIDPRKVEVNPNSIEPILTSISDLEKASIRDRFLIPTNATLFVYGGNLGKPQGVQFLIEVLQSNMPNPDVFFMVIGSGTEYSKLERWFNDNAPLNARLLPALPKADYDNLLGSCDVGLIFLDRRFTIPNFPSRILSYMEYKLPILAATDVNTDFGNEIQNNELGLWCESGNLKQFNDNVNFLHENVAARKMMGNNGHSFMLGNYSVNISYQTIIKHLSKG